MADDWDAEWMREREREKEHTHRCKCIEFLDLKYLLSSIKCRFFHFSPFALAFVLFFNQYYVILRFYLFTFLCAWVFVYVFILNGFWRSYLYPSYFLAYIIIFHHHHCLVDDSRWWRWWRRQWCCRAFALYSYSLSSLAFLLFICLFIYLFDHWVHLFIDIDASASIQLVYFFIKPLCRHLTQIIQMGDLMCHFST